MRWSRINRGCLLAIGFLIVFWGSVIFLIGGTDALGFYLRVLLVLSAFSVVGAGVGWVSRKIGVKINE